MTNNTGLIAGLYARVSTTRQEEAETIESQVAEIKARISADGNYITEDNIFVDDGWTGELLQRPSLDKMRDAVQEGKFEVLYVYDRGRISRVFAYQEIIIEEIRSKGVDFVTLHDIQAVTPEERVLQAMQGVFHEYERVKIVERFRRGKMYKAKNGVLVNAQAPYGYDYIAKANGGVSKIVVNEDEAEVVRMIFKWVGIERLSLREVRKRLYEKGVKPKKNKQGVWTSGPISRLLRNETYVTGLVYYNKGEAVVARKPKNTSRYKKVKRTSRRMRPREEWIPFQVPKILEEEWLFEKVQQVLSMNKKFASKNKKFNYLLSGLVHCQCGAKRIGDGSSTHGHHYYRCAQRIYKYPLEHSCKTGGINASLLDGFLWLNLKSFLTDPNALRSQAVRWVGMNSSAQEISKNEQEELQKKIDGIADEELRYAKAFGAGVIDFDQYSSLAKDLKVKKQSYVDRISKIKENSKVDKVLSNDEIEKLCDYARQILTDLDIEERKKIIHDIIEKVIIKDSGMVEVFGNLPEFNQKLGYVIKSRDSGIAKRREVDAF